MAEAREALREKIAEALHETTGLLAEDTLLFEDCLTLADAVLALVEVVGTRRLVSSPNLTHATVEFALAGETTPEERTA